MPPFRVRHDAPHDVWRRRDIDTAFEVRRCTHGSHLTILCTCGRDEIVPRRVAPGGVTLGRQKLTESIKNNICTGDTQRILVPGTLKIYYMKGYGAIEMGVHRFMHPKTEASNGTGEASFVQLWQFKDGNWKLTRVLSYDHHSASPKS